MSPLAPCVYLISIHNGGMKPSKTLSLRVSRKSYWINCRAWSVHKTEKYSELLVKKPSKDNYLGILKHLDFWNLVYLLYLVYNFASANPFTKGYGANEAQGCEGQGSCACWWGDSKQKHTLCLQCGKASELWPWLWAMLWFTGMLSHTQCHVCMQT